MIEGASSRAASVGTTALLRRLNSRLPVQPSSSLTWWLTAVAVTFNSAAARAKLPRRAAASKARQAFSGGSLAGIGAARAPSERGGARALAKEI